MKEISKPKTWLCLLLIISTAVLSGCWDVHPIESLAIIIALGSDVNRDNPELHDVTFGYPLYAETKRSSVRITTTTAPTFGIATEIWQTGSPLLYAAGKVRLILIGEQMAATGMTGIPHYVELAKTDDNAAIAVAKGRAEDMLRGAELPETERTGTHIAELLQTINEDGFSVRTTVIDVMSGYATPGIDPILPLLNMSAGKDVISVVGSALFRDLTMVGELDLQETQLLLALRGKSDSVTISPAVGSTAELHGTFPEIRLQSPKAKIVPVVANGQLTVQIRLNSRYLLRNYFGGANLTEQKSIDEITLDLESALTLSLQKMLAKLQAVGSDPIGIGKKLRVRDHANYDDNRFRELWKNATLDIETDLGFIRDGILLQTDLRQP